MGCGNSINQNGIPFQPHDGGPSCQLLLPELALANSLFKEGKFLQAAMEYRKFLETKFDPKREIDGLGMNEVAIGNYQSFLIKWYWQGVESKKFLGTACDALSLCYMKLKSEEEQILWDGCNWYKEMYDRYEDAYQIALGYANIFSNLGYFDDALQLYAKVNQLKPSFAPPYVYSAYIFEYKRIEPAKSIEKAQKALAIEPQNMYAEFILAKNEVNIDLRIQKVKKFCEKYPNYPRAINYIGFIYGQDKNNPTQAIVWHKKAVEVLPIFQIGLHNIGLRYAQLQNDKEAIYWQIQSSTADRNYMLPFHKLVIHFTNLKWGDAEIEEELKRHPKVLRDYFFWNLGKAYYEAGKCELSLKCYEKSEADADLFKKQIDMLYNSIANTYYKMNQNQKAIDIFLKSISINPKSHMAYYNMANVYKTMNKMEDAINSHKKSIEINPRYAYPYNNLGNIYNDMKNYDQAIKCYKKAVKHRSNYVLAMANLGVCYLKVQNFREAFTSFSRAKQLLAVNQKDLSPGNKTFLKQTLDKFNKQGETWRKSGGITPEMRLKLQQLLQSFEKNFNRLYEGSKEAVSIQKVLKKEILQIAKIVHVSEFKMDSIEDIYQLVKRIFEDNQQYFHIVPQLFIQYFYRQVFINRRSILDVEKQLFAVTKRLSEKTLTMVKTDSDSNKKREKLKDFKMKNFNPPSQHKVNIFKDAAFFKDYQEVYSEIMRVNQLAQSCYDDYRNLVDKIRKQSKGIPYGVGLKIPKAEQSQFKVILRIFEKMFKKEFTKQRVQLILSIIQKQLLKKEKQNGTKQITIGEVLSITIKVWTQQITEIVVSRKQKGTPTTCELSDLLRGKIMFDSTSNLKKALAKADQLCFQAGYKIIEMDDRLDKEQTQDVVLKIDVRGTICQLQLAIEQEESQYHFIHSIYEIERSPLGCIFGSYIYMSKGFNYPFVQNCRDIATHLKDTQIDDEKKALEAAKFIVFNLTGEFHS